MGHENQPAAALQDMSDGGQGGPQALVVGNLSLFQWHIKIHPHEHAAPFDVKIGNGQFGHGYLLCRRWQPEWVQHHSCKWGKPPPKS
jgi:hypothetical protein